MTPEAFFSTYKYYALVTSNKGVLPSIKLAQAALESNYGKSQLAAVYGNYFGIKAGAKWRGPVTNLSTTEYYSNSGGWTSIVDWFRVYTDAYRSFKDHTTFLHENGRYAFALKQTDYTAQARELQRAGYATDPGYADKLIRIIQQYGLTDYDKKKSHMKTLDITRTVLLVGVAVLSVIILIKSL